MLVRDIMTEDPTCCGLDTGLSEIAQMMVENDCGEIPICDAGGRPIGVVTDRDIVCRAVAKGINPLEQTAADCMSRPVVTASPEMSIEEATRLMEDHQVRRIPITDSSGICCGILSQADLATKGPRRFTAEVVERVSEPAAS